GDCETSAPVQPTTTVAAALITDADTRLPIGDYQYSAAGINKYGEGVEKALAGAITVTTGKSVRVTIPDEAGNTTATAYRIYRAVGAGQRYYLGMTGARASGADTTFDDNNDFIAGCTRGLILDERALTLAYLLRPTTFDLAKIADTERFMMVQYIGLLLYAARWVVELRNIGTPPTPSS
ncbi:MAG: hypothetical protein KAW17_09790, partial [Candidatus Eisenbacteria sp.]|nr:hypothetical protein [Candidatus Eisenbacteria bacterium]